MTEPRHVTAPPVEVDPAAPGPTRDVDPVWRTHRDFLRDHPRNHAGAKARAKTDCGGSLRLWEDDDGPVRVVECDGCGEKWGLPRSAVDPSVLAADRLARSRLPGALLGKPLEKIRENEMARSALRRFVETWSQPDRPLPPLLVGEPGRGKTHLLTAAASTLARTQLVHVVYWTVADLLAALRATYGTRADCAEWDRALDAPLLTLDDLGAEQLTDHNSERLAALVDHRYRLGLPLLAATNVPTDAWAVAFGARTASRLAGMTQPIRVEGPDWRVAPPPPDPA